MTLELGTKVWIPCRVSRGALPDRCCVRFESDNEGWMGFLDVDLLRDAIGEGETAVVGIVTEASSETVHVRLPGQVTRRLYFTARASELEKLHRA